MRINIYSVSRGRFDVRQCGSRIGLSLGGERGGGPIILDRAKITAPVCCCCCRRWRGKNNACQYDARPSLIPQLSPTPLLLSPTPPPCTPPSRSVTTIIKALLGDGWGERRGDSSHTHIHTRTPSNLKLNAPEFELRPNLAKLGIVPLAKFWRGIRLVGSGLKSSRWWDEEI